MPAKREEGDEVFNIKISDSDSESNKVNEMPGGANVKLPEFWAKEPSLWFVTAEGPFESKGITAESTKRAHVTAALSVEVATRVKDKLLSPHPTTPYTSLKNRLLAMFTMNSYQRACSLLDMSKKIQSSSTWRITVSVPRCSRRMPPTRST